MAKSGKIRYRTRTIVRRARRRVRGVSKREIRKGGMNAGKLLLRSGKDAVALTAIRRLPDFAGKYQGAADKVIAGVALKLFKQGGSAMIEVGIAEAMANGLDDYVIPAVGGLVGGQLKSAGATIQQVTAINPKAV